MGDNTPMRSTDNFADQAQSNNEALQEGEQDPDTGMWLFLTTLFFLIASAFFMFEPSVMGDGDSGWHLAAGRFIFEQLSIPVTDPFSYSYKGQAWTAHEWLTEVLMHGSYVAFGWNGVVLLLGLGFASTMAIVTLFALRWLTPTQTAVLATIVFVCLLPSTLARPHVLAWPFLAFWTVVMLRAREREEAPPLKCALMMLVWANLHGSYAIGLFLAATFALDAIVEGSPKRIREIVRSWGLFGLLCLLATFFTPSGPQGLLHPIFISTMQILPMIAEWEATSFSELSGFSVSLYIMLFFILLRPIQVTLIRILLIVFLFHMALSHIRHQAVFAIVVSLILAAPLARSYRPDILLPHPDLTVQLAARFKKFKAQLGLMVVLLITLVGTRLALPLARPDSSGSPGAALAQLPPELRQQRVFNEYSFGGALALQGIPVFIDGRADMYGDRFVSDYFDIASKADTDKWRAADRKWQFRWTILRPNMEITRWLDKQPEWKRFYTDDWAVIHVREKIPAKTKNSE